MMRMLERRITRRMMDQRRRLKRLMVKQKVTHTQQEV
jgi:hypothetical protein